MAKKYPQLKFIISKNQELNTYLAFLEDGKYRHNFREMNWAFYHPHPKLIILKNKDLSLNQRKFIVKKYINDFYKENIIKIKKGLNKEKRGWQKVESKFYQLTDEIFSGYKWPKGKYIAYPTIWGMYPRFLDKKTFQFPYQNNKPNYIKVIIAHEMLHFIFYDYVYKKFPKLKRCEYNYDLWNVSEAFNVIIQNSHKWVKLFNQRTVSYPEHKDLIIKFKKVWREIDGDIDKFLKRVLRFKTYYKNKDKAK